MPPSPLIESSEPLLEVIEALATPQLHADAWTACSDKNWYFGHGSVERPTSRFWKMDLDGHAAFTAIWERARPQCEALAARPLRVLRVYANGHTYGLGGSAHVDDLRPGAFTLLYYPNPEWKDDWDGETVFYDGEGEIALSVRLRPNRAVFFDSRIVHAGRAPSRLCTALRVTVAYKLEAIDAMPTPAPAPAPAPKAEANTPGSSPEIREVERDGARRVYRARIPEADIQRGVDERLAKLGESVRLPGFRAGKIPRATLEERYGARSRQAVLEGIASAIASHGLPPGSLASGCQIIPGTSESGVEIAIPATHLPDLQDPDFAQFEIERIVVEGEVSPEATSFARQHIKSQALDKLDALYLFPISPVAVEREFNAIRQLAESSGGLSADAAELAGIEAELRQIGERRLRLGAVIVELARRLGIAAAAPTELEDRVVDTLVSQATVVERAVSPGELRGMMS